MTYSTLRLAHDGAVATLTLAGRKGALGPAFWPEMAQALSELQGARALIVRGDTLFSVGLDVVQSAAPMAAALGDPVAFDALVASMHAAIEGLAARPIPVIAAVHGWCIGAGLELASACDIRLASTAARFSLPEVKLGITADLGGLQRLPRLIGQGWARQLALTGEPIDAATAARIGLVTELLDTPEALYARADQLARHLAGLPPKAIEGTKRVLEAALPHAEGLAQAVAWNAQHMDAALLEAALKRG